MVDDGRARCGRAACTQQLCAVDSGHPSTAIPSRRRRNEGSRCYHCGPGPRALPIRLHLQVPRTVRSPLLLLERRDAFAGRRADDLQVYRQMYRFNQHYRGEMQARGGGGAFLQAGQKLGDGGWTRQSGSCAMLVATPTSRSGAEARVPGLRCARRRPVGSHVDEALALRLGAVPTGRRHLCVCGVWGGVWVWVGWCVVCVCGGGGGVGWGRQRARGPRSSAMLRHAQLDADPLAHALPPPDPCLPLPALPLPAPSKAERSRHTCTARGFASWPAPCSGPGPYSMRASTAAMAPPRCSAMM